MKLRVVHAVAAVAMAGASIGLFSSPGFTGGNARSSSPAVRLNPPLHRATFAFTGDTLMHRPINEFALQPDGSYDYTSMFANVAPLVSWADVAICHLEVPVAPPGTPVIVGPVIHSTAPQIGAGLRSAGFDRCSTASNHSLDRGVAGIDATVAALTGAGVAQSGMARSAAEAIPQVFDVNGIKVAHLSYAFNLGGYVPSNEPWRANVIDVDAIVASARDARARGAEAVIVSLHWGTPAQATPDGFQRSVAQAVTASGAVDLIVGHHAHVLQPIEQVNGKWVVFGLGNFISNQQLGYWPPSSRDGAVVTVALTKNAAGAITVETPLVYPTWTDQLHGWVVRPTSEADDLSLAASVRAELAISEQRTRSLLGPFFGPG
jgi:poly-gamma-glutamate synthesis protein (capsule biosynthesis protein)